MKSFVVGLLTIFVLGVAGFYTFKATTNLMDRLNPTPSANPVASTTPSSSPSAKPSTTPAPTLEPVSNASLTKGGLPIKSGAVKGVSTTKVTTTTTTTSHLTLTLIKTSTCPISYMTEVKDMQGPLTLKYSMHDDFSFGITIWKADGNELFSNTTFGGNSGQITTISGVDYIKIRVESKDCGSDKNNWLTLTAER